MAPQNMTIPNDDDVRKALEIIHSGELEDEREETICLEIFNAHLLGRPLPNYVMMAFRDVIIEYDDLTENAL